MHHAVPDLQRGIDPRGTCARDEGGGVVEEHFVGADLNQERREPAQVAVERGGQGCPRVGRAEVRGDHAS